MGRTELPSLASQGESPSPSRKGSRSESHPWAPWPGEKRIQPLPGGGEGGGPEGGEKGLERIPFRKGNGEEVGKDLPVLLPAGGESSGAGQKQSVPKDLPERKGPPRRNREGWGRREEFIPLGKGGKRVGRSGRKCPGQGGGGEERKKLEEPGGFLGGGEPLPFGGEPSQGADPVDRESGPGEGTLLAENHFPEEGELQGDFTVEGSRGGGEGAPDVSEALLRKVEEIEPRFRRISLGTTVRKEGKEAQQAEVFTELAASQKGSASLRIKRWNHIWVRRMPQRMWLWSNLPERCSRRYFSTSEKTKIPVESREPALKNLS